MQQIKIYFCDFWKEHNFENDFFVNILKDKYDLVLEKKNPDFVICSCYGNEHRKFKCPKIFYTGENITPDFNIYDYAIGFDYINFQQRYLRVPIYFFLEKIRKTPAKVVQLEKRDFCSFLYSNGIYADKIRVNFFKQLSKYKKIDSSGKLLNNTGKRIKDKIEYLSKFKFTIAFENSSSEGYTTEKITDAFLANTIPIYWGNPLIAEEFNPKSFICISNFQSLEDAIKKIIEIDNNDQLYLEMINAPKIIKKTNYNKDIIDFFENIFSNKGKILRKDNNPGWDNNGKFYLYSPFRRGIYKKIRSLLH